MQLMPIITLPEKARNLELWRIIKNTFSEQEPIRKELIKANRSREKKIY